MSAPTRQLREAFECLTADVGEVDALVFTTFGLDVEFFEDSVLGPLAVDQLKLSSAQDVFGASEYCQETNVGVFYDANATEAVEKRVTFQTHPVFLENGAFHPKVILVSGRTGGERVVRLLVGSANLSLAGWAKNREIFATVEVTDAATARPLLELLEFLVESQDQRAVELRERYGPVLDHLSDVAQREAGADSPRLHVTIPGRTPSMMERLRERTIDELTVYSPYFGKEPFDYLRRACPDGTLRVVAAQDEDGRLPLPVSEVDELLASETSAVKLARLPDTEGDGEYRFDHLKAYAWPGALVVGSHNATEAALGTPDGGGSQNVEVSVEFPDVAPLETAEFAEPPEGTPEEELSSPEDFVEKRLSASIGVTANWKEDVYEIELGEPMPDCDIDLPGLETNPRLDERRLTVAFTEQAQVELLEQKWFEVYRRSPQREQVYRGLVNEKHWRTYRREAVLDSLTACFDAWVAGTVDDPTAQDEHLVSASERLLADAENRAQPLRTSSLDDDLFENYFRFFRASQGYCERLGRAIGNGDVTGCVRLLVSAPGSLERVVELAEEQVERDGEEFWSVYRFVLAHEMERLLDRVRDSAGHLEEVMDVVDDLEPRVASLVECFEQHPAWQNVRARDEVHSAAKFALREMGYLDD